jgi:hypothetical protein
MAPFYRQIPLFAEIGAAFCATGPERLWSGLAITVRLLPFLVGVQFQFLDVVHKKIRSDDRPEAY